MHKIMVLIPALWLLCPAAGANAQSAPSFDCRKASSAPERTICKDPQLARLDARVAAAYAAKRKQLPPNAAKVLQSSQQEFLAARDTLFGLYAKSPKLALSTPAQMLAEQVEAIERVAVAPARDFSGYWENTSGGWSIERRKGGRYRVRGNAVEPADAQGVCDIQGIARVERGALVIDSDADTDGKPPDRYQLSREGNVLRVKLVRTASEYGVEGSCGLNVTLVGDYLLTTRPASFLFN